MSLFSFAKNFAKAGGESAAEALTIALVNAAPETATAAQLKQMEEDLDGAGTLITKLQTELAAERKSYNAINTQYGQMMGAAENLQHQIDGATDHESRKESLTTSLTNLLGKIEAMAPELDQDKADVDATQALLTEAETAYREKATALTAAKGNLDRAKHDMQHASIQEQRAEQRAEDAAKVAGLRSGASGSGVNVAMEAMNRSAVQARSRAATLNLKTKALGAAKEADEDPNIKAAMAAAAGTTTSTSVTDRLAALKNRK